MKKKTEPKQNVSKRKVWPNSIACGYFDCHLPKKKKKKNKKHPLNAPKHPQTRTLKVGIFPELAIEL